jgi:hypothetical protein
VGQGLDSDPYGDAGGFTPYQPDATPDGEPPAEGAPPPFVPYGGSEPAVPYGGASVPSYYATTTTKPSGGRRVVVPLLIGLGVLVASCGGGIAAIVGVIGGSDSGSSSSSSHEVFVNDLEAGQCLNGAGFFTDEPVSGLEIVDCSSAHDVQVLEVNVLDSKEAAKYDFNDPNSSKAVCDPVLSDSQKALVRGRDFGLVAFTETGSPGVNDKVACLVKRADNTPIHEFLPVAGPEPPA